MALEEFIRTETSSNSFTKSDIKRCFGNGVKNTAGSTIYIVKEKTKNDNRYCHIAFMNLSYVSSRNYSISTIRYDDWKYEKCIVKALSCLRPEKAKEMSEKFNISIDTASIPQQ